MAESGTGAPTDKPSLIPLYGFLEGDTMGLVIVVHAEERVSDLAEKLQRAANVRVPRRERYAVWHRGQKLSPYLTIDKLDLAPLDRIDVTSEDNDALQARTTGN